MEERLQKKSKGVFESVSGIKLAVRKLVP